MSTIKNKIVDVLIVGDGIAGCIAALAARQRGAGVIISKNLNPTCPTAIRLFAGALSGEFPVNIPLRNISRIS
jgi:succinate dehydrogenase/fumarate reductase flavoprotein subunit